MLIIFIAYIALEVYCFCYFKGDKFKDLYAKTSEHIKNCNELNIHIEELKASYVNIKSYDYGQGALHDTSKFNFKRGEWRNFAKSSRTHNCSAAVLGSVRNQPIRYLCKYFKIETTEGTLSDFEGVLNAFSAAEQGKSLLANERNSIINGIKNSVPGLIFSLRKKRLVKRLGFEFIDLSNIYFPVYTFRYTSAGGNSSAKYDLRLDVQNLEILIDYLSKLVKFRKSVRGQRALMTTRLRELIKSRDNFTCQICNISGIETRNLLLEIDHIKPISRGGMTSMENLQTLCWKCNRAKGARILDGTSYVKGC